MSNQRAFMSGGFKCAVAPNPAQERNPNTMHSPATRSLWFVGCWLLPLGMSQAQFNDGVTMGLGPADEAAPELAFPDPDAQVHPYEHVHHAYAQVLNVQPVYEIPAPEYPDHCDRHELLLPDHGDHMSLPTVDDEGDEATPDNEIAIEEDCLPDEETDQEPILVGYDVEYRYRGEVFISRLNEYPGDRLRIRVAIAPIELTGVDEGSAAPDEELPPDDAEDELHEDPAFP